MNIKALRVRILSGFIATALASTGMTACAAPRAAQRPATPAAPQAKRPMNVLFIMADDFRTFTGAYGAKVKTPNLDRFARESTRFDQAYVQWPLCGTSRASFLTGLRPNSIGESVNWEKFRCSVPDIVTLPQYFKNAGYESIRVGKAYHQGVPSDIGTGGPDDPASWSRVVNPSGHDHLKETEARIINKTPGIGLGRAMAYLPDTTEDTAQTDGMVANEAIRTLKEAGDKPFFLFAGFYRPHVPEVAPKKYFDMYPPAREKLADETSETIASTLPIARGSQVIDLGMNKDQQRQMIAAYKAATSFMDAQVGRILDELKRSGHDKDTIVVFAGDHGFLLGEHGQWEKNMLWNEATRIPLMIHVPGMKPGVSTKLVEMLNIYPTLLEMAGLPAYARNEGVSMAPLLRNPSDPAWNRPAYSQVYGARSVRMGEWRYSEWLNGKRGRELYNLTSDPKEHHNLAQDPAHAKTVAWLSSLLPKGAVESKPPLPDGNPQAPKPERGGPPFPFLPNANNCADWDKG